MELSNFVITGRVPVSYVTSILFAEVDVTTGVFWWKKTVRRAICKKDVSWFFVDTGSYTPGFEAERLEQADWAQRLLPA